MSPPFDFYQIDGKTVLASSEAQARTFVYQRLYAKEIGDPGIVDRHFTIRYCTEPECSQPARESCRCHHHDPNGEYQRNLQERRKAA